VQVGWWAHHQPATLGNSGSGPYCQQALHPAQRGDSLSFLAFRFDPAGGRLKVFDGTGYRFRWLGAPPGPAGKDRKHCAGGAVGLRTAD